MKKYLSSIEAGENLTADAVREICDCLVDENVSVDERADFLCALHHKGESAGEIAAFADGMIQKAVSLPLSKETFDGPLIDVCGTGGDGKNFFNVSTTVMFVVAACGGKVVKHGNRSITSQCGGADVLEALGAAIDFTPEKAVECLKQTGAVFLFAPAYHPAFKAIGPVRKKAAEKGSRTIFNILGPLLNPAKPDFQLTGIFSNRLLKTYAEALHRLGRTRAWVVSGSLGEDEISVISTTDAVEMCKGEYRAFAIEPRSLGLAQCRESDLIGGNATANASIIEGILKSDIADARRDIVVLNAAAALVVCGIAKELPEGISRAIEAIQQGSAYGVLDKMRGFR